MKHNMGCERRRARARVCVGWRNLSTALKVRTVQSGTITDQGPEKRDGAGWDWVLGVCEGGGGVGDCNLSPLFQRRAAGERRCWGLCSLYGPAEALLSITELLHFFLELGTPKKKFVFNCSFSSQYLFIKFNKISARLILITVLVSP